MHQEPGEKELDSKEASMKKILKNDWADLLEDEFKKDYYLRLRAALIQEYKKHIIYPDMHDIFNALHFTPYKNVKVVILGQDPYHGERQAHGLSFSVRPGVRIPPSLLNIYKELRDDLGYDIPNHGYLEKWAKQGVLLLNTTLTVRKSQPDSHRKIGWGFFTDRIMAVLNERKEPMVFILWGSHARAYKRFITNPWHHIIESPHPSPFSANRGFFGSKPFSRANAFLRENNIEPIDWQIKNLDD